MSQRRIDPPRLPEPRNLPPAGLIQQEEVRRLHASQYRQTLACFSATLTMFTVGTVYGWSTTTLGRIKSGTNDHMPLKLRHYEYSWIISLTVLGSVIGSLVCANLADRIGRKYCLLISSSMVTVGWYIVYFAKSLPLLYFARVIHGIAIGMARTINPMYVSEIADVSIRGMLGTLIVVNAYAGSMLTCALEFWLTYDDCVFFLAMLSFVPTVSNACFPETPYFLVAKGQKKQACKSLAYYKRILDRNEVKSEIRAIRAQTRYELHPESRYELDQQSRRDLPSPSRTDLPAQSRSNLSPQSRSNLSPQSRSNLSPQSISERRSNPIQQVDIQHISDLHLPSTSRGRAISVVRSEVIPTVHQQPRDDSRFQASREAVRLAIQQLRASYSLSTSELPARSELQPPARSELQPPARSELQPRARSELQSRARSDLGRQPNVDSRASADTDEIHIDGTKYTGFTKLKCILQRSNKKALLIMFGLIMANQLGGHFITMQFVEMLYKKIKIANDLYKATLLVRLVNVLFSSYTMFKVDSVGRRTLLILSTLGTSVTLSTLAYYRFFVDHELHSPKFDFIIPLFLIMYQVTFQIGLATMPTVLLCELFPTELNGFVGAIIVIFDSIFGFIVSKLFQVISVHVGTYAVYIIFGTSCTVAFLMVYLCIPETKGKTYTEIEALLVSENFNSSNEEARIDESNIHRS